MRGRGKKTDLQAAADEKSPFHEKHMYLQHLRALFHVNDNKNSLPFPIPRKPLLQLQFSEYTK